MDYESIQTEFFKLETDLELFNQTIENVYFWKLIRIYVYLDIVQKITKISVGHPNAKNIKIVDKIVENQTS